MSMSLLKKSLEMFQGDLSTEKSHKSKKKKSDPMKLIGTNKRGIKKKLQKLNKQEKQQGTKNSKRLRTAAEDIASCQSRDLVEGNLLNLKRIAALSAVKNDDVTKVLEHHRGRLAKDQPSKPDKLPEPESILFDCATAFDKEKVKDDFWQ